MPDAKILIVEDEAISAMDIQQRLAALGYPLPDIAYNAEEGLGKVEKTRPDLVLMDIMMPGKMDGVAAAEQIRSRFDIPIIFLTAYSDETTLRRAKITAPYGYILKPFQERELHITVDMALYRHKLERELKERKEWLEITLRSIGDGVIATDEKGLITFINPVAESLMGFKLEDVRQRNLTEVLNIVNRDTRKPVENPVTKVLLEGNIVGLANHTVLIARDGKEIPINDSAAPIKDDHGNILGVILVFSDLTEREKAEESLRESQKENEFLAGLIRASSQPVGIGYPDGRLGLVNRAFEELTGYAADELRSMNWAEALTPPEWLDMEKDKLAELHHTGQSVRYEKEYIRKDGTRVPVELLVHLVTDSNGKPQYYYAFLTDLTERMQAEEKVIKLNEELRRNVADLSAANTSLRDSRRAALNLMEDAIEARRQAEQVSENLRQEIAERKLAEKALRESETRLSRAQEIAHLGSWELDLVKNELTWSDEVYRIFGLKPQVFRATYEAFLERIHPEDRALVDEAYSNSVREGKDTYEIEHRVVRKGTGEVRWVHEKSQHFRDATERIIRSVGMVHDITERKKAEEDLRRLSEELKRSNSDLEQFAYIASHDLQSPLRNVEGFVQLLARRYKGKLDGKADEFIHYISTGVKDMQMLILDILEYSKVGSGGAAFSEIDISLCISKALANLKDVVAEKNADIILEGPFPAVSGDSVQIASLFQNLIGNGIKFCNGMPKIHIAAKKEGREHIFSVRDNGIGINPKDSDKIFAVFHRLHTKTEYPGTGIGLAICKKIVDRHGGRIWVESEPGKGSTFFFSLPAEE